MQGTGLVISRFLKYTLGHRRCVPPVLSSGRILRLYSPHVVMVNRLSVELESASSLLSTTSQVETARFPIVPGISGGIERASVIITVHISIVIRAVPVMRQTETDLAGAVAVGMRGGHRRAGVRMRMTEAVAVRRRREMT